MKVYTSYFARIKELKRLGYIDFVAVSGYVPKFYHELMQNDISFRRMIELAPKKDWFFRWKNNEFDNNEYIRLYNETVLNVVNFDDIRNRLKEGSVLLCYEKPTDFCHRHLIADWLNKKGIECEEISF